MFRRKFLASLAGVFGAIQFSRVSRASAKTDTLPINPLLASPDVAYGSPGDELDGLSPHAAFMLGVEWKTFWNQLCDNPDSFCDLVHPANVTRCLDLAIQQYSRTAKLAAPGAHSWAAPHEGDWRVIEIGPCPFRHRSYS